MSSSPETLTANPATHPRWQRLQKLRDTFRDIIRHAMRHKIRNIIPGFSFCLVIYFAAGFVTEHYGGAVILTALLMGMAFSNLSLDARYQPGIDWSARKLLRIGVALLGLQVHMEQLRVVHWQPVILVLTTVPITILFSLILGKTLKLSHWHSLLAGAAVAICGVSAALAVVAVLPRQQLQERFILCVLVGVTGLSTTVMVLYPILIAQFTSSGIQQALFLGATIHDVAQVAGAGYLISDAVGELATFTKMLRVAMLIPLVMILNFAFRHQRTEQSALPIPLFLLGFALLLVCANLGWIPAEVSTVANGISRFCLIMTVAALGAKTILTDLFQLGWKPLTLMTGNTLFLALLTAMMLWGMQQLALH